MVGRWRRYRCVGWRFGVPRYGVVVIESSGEVVEVLSHIRRIEWVGWHGGHCDFGGVFVGF
jgi:hypothetical protein